MNPPLKLLLDFFVHFGSFPRLFTLPSIQRRKVHKLPSPLKFGKGKKDNKIVFVAEATSKVGSPVVK